MWRKQKYRLYVQNADTNLPDGTVNVRSAETGIL